MKKFMSSFSISQNERTFVIDGLKEKTRVDGRRMFDVRTVKITFGSTYGIAEVQLGTTR
jgi:exosome complex component RRP45